jgi:hypothetical protein
MRHGQNNGLGSIDRISRGGLERGLEKLGLAVREGWEVERGLAERGRGDYYERVEGYCLTDEQGNIYVASVKWVFQVMGDGRRRFWFEGVELGRAKVESVEDVVARITGGAVDRAEGREEEGQDHRQDQGWGAG